MSARFLVSFALFALGIFQTGLSADAEAEKFDPKAPGIAHFEHVWKAEPFIKETKVLVNTPGLAAKYALVGLVGSGKNSVAFLVDRNEGDPAKGRLMLAVGTPDKKRNVELVSISIDKDVRKSTVLIRQGGEQATLPFDQTTIANAGIGVQGAGAGAMPGVPMPPQQNMIAPQAAMGAVPPPAMVPPPQPGQIQSTSSGIPNPAGEQTPPTPTRRIIRPKPINVN